VVDVMASHAAGDDGNHRPAVPAQREEIGQAAGMTRWEQARYEREVAALDLADAAQAMARSQPRQDVGRPADSSQADLAMALYASADRHRRLAERLESGDGAPGTPDEVP
jgi:hypothetical protein